MTASSRYALGVEYDGSAFLGFQTQRQTPTVQQTLQQAVSRVADHQVTIHGAGRTDTGVHARCQVVHFDTIAERDDRSWLLGVNSNLPDAAAVRWVKRVNPEFHARFSATARVYCYRIYNRPVRPVLRRWLTAWERRPLDEAAMQAAASAVVGEHDFSAFRAQSCSAQHPVRRLYAVEVSRRGEEVEIWVDGNAFLHHMVRNLVGSLILVGAGERSPEWLAEVLRGRDRTEAGPTAPASGLCLESVRYPRQFGLPE